MAKQKVKALGAEAPQAVAEERVRVRSVDGSPFWERHPRHPQGEVWVAGHNGQAGPAVEVALTPAVERALKDGRLERVPGNG